MTSEPTGKNVSPAAKKGLVLFLIAVAAVSVVIAFLSQDRPPRGPRIISEGDRAPGFSVVALDGRNISLADLRGKVVMLHFWATWCPPCVDEIPTIEKLYRTLPGKDFEILAVSVDEEGAETVNAFLQQNKLTLPVQLDPRRAVAGLYGTFKYPETYIIDRSGVVRYKVIGPRNWDDPVTLKALRDLADGK
ncbi:MAG: hypothetical protein A2010_11140 [Nitrospirae bacterium GWD2_57_9]|nr:MAG: hypothetical protein A2010_11140 [Nitrospirae bacterium GWD2_57_9]OGW50434.1 MAG: hypothetical protein A2078_06595 [Nitrospirae bacterium GWC2_57_9]